jgi:2-polyprenyl-3-methyl-5-hydroxy-6-metoxy-1,4-benzoquinol methylase
MATDKQDKFGVASYYDEVAANYGERYDRRRHMSLEKYPANYFRLQILLELIERHRMSTLYEVGVGEGTPLSIVHRAGVRVAGCDISEAMVSRARERLASNGGDPLSVTWGDIEDSITLVDQCSAGPYDAVVAFGVLPHVKNDLLMLKNIRNFCRPGGRILIEFRNSIFSMFTFNKFTRDFILNELLANTSDVVKSAVAADLAKRLAVDIPVITEGAYDSIFAKFHNPFDLPKVIENAGFKDPTIHWYHYHPAPPMLEEVIGREVYREEAAKLEHSTDSWRGIFLCSAGLIEAVRSD